MRIFGWWFMWGGLTTFAVLLLQGGIHDLLARSGTAFSENVFNFFLTIMAGGLLAGCVAKILDRIRSG
jgi:hypothetical protein